VIPSFPALIKELRDKLDYTQQEMADALHVSRVQISRWENGTMQPALAELFCAFAPHWIELLKESPPKPGMSLLEWAGATQPKRYTSQQLRAAAASEIINCMGLAKDAATHPPWAEFHPAIHEYGKTLVARIPAILDAPDDPIPASSEYLQAMLVLGRQKLREVRPDYKPPRKQ
jgi:transcriptional regulator with XRE-family HTH domain